MTHGVTLALVQTQQKTNYKHDMIFQNKMKTLLYLYLDTVLK